MNKKLLGILFLSVFLIFVITTSQSKTERFVVFFNESLDDVYSDFITKANEFGAKIYGKSNLFNAVFIECNELSVNELKKLRYVKNILIDEKSTQLQYSYQNTTLNATYFHNLNITGNGTIVAVIDSSGINFTYSIFGSCTNESFLNGSCDKVKYGWDFVTDRPIPEPINDHATNIGKIILDFAPDTVLYTYRTEYLSQDLLAFENATKNGVDVISFSMGMNKYQFYSDYIKPILDNNTVFVASAGNNFNEETVEEPANTPSAIAVGSCDNSLSYISSFSSKGYVIDNSTGEYFVVKPDLVAIGQDIDIELDGDKKTIQGTSFSTPMVAGLIALLRSARPNLTAWDVRSIIITTANDIGYRPNYQGSGVVDIVSAINSYLVITPTSFITHIYNQENITKNLTIKNIANHTITINSSFKNDFTGGFRFYIDNYEVIEPNSTINLTITVEPTFYSDCNFTENYIIINDSDGIEYRIPFVIFFDTDYCVKDTTYVYNDKTFKRLTVYRIDEDNDGVIRIVNQAKLDCNGTTIIGNGSGIGIYIDSSGVELINCSVYNFSIDIYSNFDFDGNYLNASKVKINGSDTYNYTTSDIFYSNFDYIESNNINTSLLNCNVSNLSVITDSYGEGNIKKSWSVFIYTNVNNFVITINSTYDNFYQEVSGYYTSFDLTEIMKYQTKTLYYNPYKITIKSSGFFDVYDEFNVTDITTRTYNLIPTTPIFFIQLGILIAIFFFSVNYMKYVKS